MAVAIKNIPILTGAAAERFEALAESSRTQAMTAIPHGAREAIHRMMERSHNVQLRFPRQ